MTAVSDTPAARRDGALYWLALGAFAVGTEGFMIAAVLPKIARDLGTTVGAAGQLVTFFALAYAVSSPVLTALTGKVGRRTLLMLSMGGFALANLVAAAAPNFWGLVAARILLALFAGLYVPGANALAGAMVAPERRGRALAIVNGGLTVAIAIGVPLGAVMGNALGWRPMFLAVAVLGALAFAGLAAGLPKDVGAGLKVANLVERIRVARQPVIFFTLLVTTFWAIGAYTVYTYVVPLLGAILDLGSAQTSAVLSLWGVCAGLGLFLSGAGVDRLGARPVILGMLALAAAVLVTFSLVGHLAPRHLALVPVLAIVALWGTAHWGFWPAQQARLIELGGLSGAPIALSLNASFMYLGFSLGAAFGAAVMAHSSVLDVGFAGGTSVVVALLLFLSIEAVRRRAAIATA